MADGTKIEWTDATWTPVKGCTRVSPGCGGPGPHGGCYAEIMAARFSKPGQWGEGLAEIVTLPDGRKDHRWTGVVRFDEAELLKPLRWKRPRKIFVCSTADLFHEKVEDEWIDRVFAVMALCPQHTFQVLTKRPERMREYLSKENANANIAYEAIDIAPVGRDITAVNIAFPPCRLRNWPLPNVWCGTSVEDQKRADERIPHLRETPAAVRFISFEPLLGAVETDFSGIGWAIVGGESGPGARPMHPDRPRSLRDQCAAAGVAFLFKQWGEWLPWEPEHLPNWKAQDGRMMDRHHLPDFNDAALKGWTDDCLYEGDDICVHERVGKKAAGRLLDGVQHDGFPG